MSGERVCFVFREAVNLLGGGGRHEVDILGADCTYGMVCFLVQRDLLPTM